MRGYKSGELLVKYRSSYETASRRFYRRHRNISTIRRFRKIRTEHVRLPKNLDVKQALEMFRNDPDVVHVEPNYRYAISEAPDDPEYGKLWGLHNTGQRVNGKSGTSDADIDAPEAWDIAIGAKQVLVAVIDTGVDYNHPDLSPNLWTNPGEIPDNGTDDDGNGKVDDVLGWDFVDEDNDPMDYNSHGTHVAGTIAAAGNNGKGVTGVNWSSGIMILRGLDTEGFGYTDDLIDAIEYAASQGADVINISWGSDEESQFLKDAIEASGAVVVCSAGNDSVDIDATPHYPASFDSQNIIAVAASNQNDELADFSNFGTISVDVAAPGSNIYSTLPARKTVWEDNFDEGNIDDWTLGGSGGDWALTSAESYSGTYALTDSPNSDYQNNSDLWAMSPAVNLSASVGAKLVFRFMGDTEPENDVGYLQASSDGATWVDLEGFEGTTGGSWERVIVDLKDFEGGTVYFRFRFTSNSSVTNDGVYIDDVIVTAASLSFDGAEYGFKNGTSMAAPHVSGLAALLKSYRPALTPTQIKSTIEDSVDRLFALNRKTATGGRINAYRTLARFSWITGTDSSDLSDILRDDHRDVIYLADAGNSQLVVIDTQSETVSRRIPINGYFGIRDIAINKDNTTLAIAGSKLMFMDLDTYEVRELSTGHIVVSVTFDGKGNLYFLTSMDRGLIYHYNPDTERVIRRFGSGTFLDKEIWENGFVTTDPTGQRLYVAETIGSRIHAFDISGNRPIFLAKKSLESSSFRDFVVSPILDELYVACSAPYGIQVLDKDTLESKELLWTGPYPIGVATDRSGLFVYGLPYDSWTNRLYQFDVATHMLRHTYSFFAEHHNDHAGERGIAIDRSGTKTFIIHGSDYYDRYKVHVYPVSNTQLYVAAPETAREGDGLLEGLGSVSISPAATSDVTVSLDSSDTSEVTVPATIVIQAGQDTTSYSITVEDDTVLDGTQSASISASATGYPSAVDTIAIKDNETATLTLYVPNSASEDDHVLVGAGTVSASAPVADEVNVSLRSDDTSEITVPETVTIPSGQTSVSFDLTVVNDGFVDGTQTATITATVPGWTSGSAGIEIEDDEDNTLTVVVPDTSLEGDGVLQGAGRVSISGKWFEDLVINLSSSDTTEVQVPPSVTIASGHTSATFDLTIIHDHILDDTQSVTITAASAGWISGNEFLDVQHSFKYESEFKANTYTNQSQARPAIYRLSDGNIVMTWNSFGQDGDSFGVFGKIYDSMGDTLKNTFQINTYTSGTQWHSSVSHMSGGGFVVVWDSQNQDGSEYGIFGQMFDEHGNRVGQEFQVNTYTTGNQKDPKVAALSNGGFVVTWWSWFSDGRGGGVFCQIYDSAGNRVSDEFRSNSNTTGYNTNPDIAVLPEDKFIVTWNSSNQDGSLSGVFGQIHDSTGARVGNEFQINSFTLHHQYWPDVTVLDDNDFVVTWTSHDQDGSEDGIYGQRFDGFGNRIGSEFRVNTHTENNQSYSSVAALSTGGFVVVWESRSQDGSGYGIYGQIYDKAGNSFGSEFRVNTDTYNDQRTPSAVGLPGGYFAVAWEGLNSPPGSIYDVFFQLFAAEDDTDRDGVADVIETANGTDPFDTDTDNDGISDGGEDTNHNGVKDSAETDPRENDTDKDGLQDGTETGVTLADIGPDTDLTVFVPDADPTTTTAPLDPDSDKDGQKDGYEDADLNGRIDPGEGDPNDPNVLRVLKGDLNGDAAVDLTDVILGMQVLTGVSLSPDTIRSDYVTSGSDVNGDQRIGVEEIVYGLEIISQLR